MPGVRHVTHVPSRAAHAERLWLVAQTASMPNAARGRAGDAKSAAGVCDSGELLPRQGKIPAGMARRFAMSSLGPGRPAASQA